MSNEKVFISIDSDKEGLEKITKQSLVGKNVHINLGGGDFRHAVQIGKFLKTQDCNFYVYNALSAGVITFLMLPFKRIKLYRFCTIWMHQPLLSTNERESLLELEPYLELAEQEKRYELKIAGESDHPEAFKREWGSYCGRKAGDTLLFSDSWVLKDYPKF